MHTKTHCHAHTFKHSTFAELWLTFPLRYSCCFFSFLCFSRYSFCSFSNQSSHSLNSTLMTMHTTARPVIRTAMKTLIPMCQLLDVSSPSWSSSGHWELHRIPDHNKNNYYKSKVVSWADMNTCIVRESGAWVTIGLIIVNKQERSKQGSPPNDGLA